MKKAIKLIIITISLIFIKEIYASESVSLTIKLMHENNIIDNYNNLSQAKFEKNKTLQLLLDGNNFENKDYTIKVDIYSTKDLHNLIYTKTTSSFGQILNSEYKITLENIPIHLPTNPEDNYEYKIETTISLNNQIIVKKENYFTYVLDGKINTYIAYKNLELAKEEINDANNTILGKESTYQITTKEISEKNKLNIFLQGANIDDDKTYTIEIYNDSNQLQKKYITSGKELSEKGIIYKSNLLQDKNILIILKLNEWLVFYHKMNLNKVNSPMITSFEITKNNNYIGTYLDVANVIYNQNSTWNLKGVGFEENEKYNITLKRELYKNSKENEEIITKEYKYNILGKEINNGYLINIDALTNDEINYKTNNLTITLENSENEIKKWLFYVENEEEILKDFLTVENNVKNLIEENLIEMYKKTGDMNKNDEIEFTDVIILLKKYLNIEEIKDDDILIGDMNENNEIEFMDVIILLRKFLGIEE